MREICTYGSERGALGNQRSYRTHPAIFSLTNSLVHFSPA